LLSLIAVAIDFLFATSVNYICSHVIFIKDIQTLPHVVYPYCRKREICYNQKGKIEKWL
jgi:hypothetical protein